MVVERYISGKSGYDTAYHVVCLECIAENLDLLFAVPALTDYNLFIIIYSTEDNTHRLSAL